MPNFFGNILVVSAEELVPQFFKTKNYLSVQLTRHEKRGYGLKRARRGGGKDNEILVLFDSLPEYVRAYLGDPRKVDNVLQNYFSESANAFEYYTNSDGNGFAYPDGSFLEEHTIDQLTINASVMLAAKQLYSERQVEWQNKGKGTRSLLSTVFNDVVAFNEVLKITLEDEEIRHTLPTSYRRFRPLFDQFVNSETPFRELIKDAEGKRKLNAQKCDEKHTLLLNSLFTSQPEKPHYTKVANQYKSFISGDFDIYDPKTGESYNAADYHDLSSSTIRTELAKYKNKLGTYALRSGDPQKLMQQFKPYQAFEKPKFAGSLISIDDRQPPFWYDKNRSRMWFYIGMDVASGAFTTFVYGKTKEGLIIEFYRQMVRFYAAMGWNLPHQLEAEMSLNSSYKTTLLKPGAMFQEVSILPNNPRAKRIEREFGKLRYELEKEHEGWIARPFAKSEHNQEGADKIKVIPYDTLAMQCIMDIKRLNELPHPDRPDLTRWEYQCQNQNPDLKPTNYKSILNYIGYEEDSSCRVARIQLQNKKWLIGDQGSLNTGEDLTRVLDQIEGKDLKIKWIDDVNQNVLKAMVFQEGRYICELIEEPKGQKAKIERTPADEVAFEAFKAYRKTIEAYQKVRKADVVKVGVVDSRPAKKDTFDLSVFGIDVGKYESTKDKETETVSKSALDDQFGEDFEEGSYKQRNWNDHIKIEQ